MTSYNDQVTSFQVTTETKIVLFEKGKLLSNETEVTETFNKFFKNALTKIDVNRDDAKFNDETVLSTNPAKVATQKFDNHPSVKLISDNIAHSDMFQFKSFSLDDILKEITNLNSPKMVFQKHSNLLYDRGCGYLQSYFNLNFGVTK